MSDVCAGMRGSVAASELLKSPSNGGVVPEIVPNVLLLLLPEVVLGEMLGVVLGVVPELLLLAALEAAPEAAAWFCSLSGLPFPVMSHSALISGKLCTTLCRSSKLGLFLPLRI